MPISSLAIRFKKHRKQTAPGKARDGAEGADRNNKNTVTLLCPLPLVADRRARAGSGLTGDLWLFSAKHVMVAEDFDSTLIAASNVLLSTLSPGNR